MWIYGWSGGFRIRLLPVDGGGRFKNVELEVAVGKNLLVEADFLLGEGGLHVDRFYSLFRAVFCVFSRLRFFWLGSFAGFGVFFDSVQAALLVAGGDGGRFTGPGGVGRGRGGVRGRR